MANVIDDFLTLPTTEVNTIIVELPFDKEVIFPEVHEGIICLTLNIRSLRVNIDNFLLYLNYLKQKPKIIILTEIWI